jgi:nicotinamidase-related amidase
VFITALGHLHNAVKDVMEKVQTIPNTVALVEEARKKGVHIIHSPVLFSADYKELVQPSYGILKVSKPEIYF